jgi:predicted component of viral defense system (DUF524 family)
LIPLGEGVSLRLEEDLASPSTASAPRQPVPGLPEGWLAVGSARRLDAAAPADRPPLLYDPSAPDRGLGALRLFELRDYYWTLEFNGGSLCRTVTLTSSLAKSKDCDLWKARDTHGRFRFVNYLGSAWIEATVDGLPPVRIPFEVASPKLDYEQEYRSMVEAIGAECQQLLLEWGTATSLNLATDPTKQHQILLEQFLFLRHVLGTERLDLYLETITRRPHSRLERELDWKPAGNSDPALFLSDPLRYGRDWRRIEGRLLPAEIQEERKFDSLDTPPNRFIKFALQSFRSLCEAVLAAKKGDQPAFAPDDAVALEAGSMLRSLDAFLALPLFDGVGALRRVPFDSITLQRREGYRELLLAWLMLDAAAQLDWPGREDAYNGTTRNVATLYEFWLYFLLVRAFQEQLGMVAEKDPLAEVDGALPFCCCAEGGRLIINLHQGEASFTRFRWQKNGRQLRVHFFYNRSFGRKAVGERGSYSKTFRPDYSLVIIPEEFDARDWRHAEREAEAKGRIAYLHFDAKYRGENLPAIFGTDGTVEEDQDEPRSRAEGSVKNADLYKMHTYNEAIRRTVGSYVLYPGAATDPRNAPTRFERYHEIIPGIGAFALRPSPNGALPTGLLPLCDFIRDVLTHQLDRFAQSYRIDYWTHDTIKDKPSPHRPPINEPPADQTPPADMPIVVGFIRADAAAPCRTRALFYFHAVENSGLPTPFDHTVLQARLLVPYRRGKWLGWYARIASCSLVSRLGLIQRMAEDQQVVGEAQFYYVLELDSASIKDFRTLPLLPVPSPGPPELKKWPDLFPPSSALSP